MIDTGLCKGGTCVVVMDVAAMGMGIVPIVKVLEWGRRGLRCALGGIIATAAIEGHAAALVVSATIIVASVESVSTAAVVGATTAAAGLSLLALGFVVGHAGRLVLKDFGCFAVGIEACRQGAGCQLHCRAFGSAPDSIAGVIVAVYALLHGGVRCAKVGNSVSQGGGSCIILYGIHAVAMLQGRGGCEGCNVDGGLPKGMECGKVHVMGWVVAVHDPGLVFLCKEASLVDDANTNADDVIIRDGMLGKVGKRSSPEQACDKEFKPQ